jgi:hypothetical protein
MAKYEHTKIIFSDDCDKAECLACAYEQGVKDFGERLKAKITPMAWHHFKDCVFVHFPILREVKP